MSNSYTNPASFILQLLTPLLLLSAPDPPPGLDLTQSKEFDLLNEMILITSKRSYDANPIPPVGNPCAI